MLDRLFKHWKIERYPGQDFRLKPHVERGMFSECLYIGWLKSLWRFGRTGRR